MNGKSRKEKQKKSLSKRKIEFEIQEKIIKFYLHGMNNMQKMKILIIESADTSSLDRLAGGTSGAGVVGRGGADKGAVGGGSGARGLEDTLGGGSGAGGEISGASNL